MHPIGAFEVWADLIEKRHSELVEILTECETEAVALVEIEKSVRALRTYQTELPAVAGRRPMGSVYVSLPFNNPLYSLILYCCGPLLAGNSVLCRPSSMTAQQVEKITALSSAVTSNLPFAIDHRTGSQFLSDAAANADCVIFTGAWENVLELRRRVANRLVYCGPGLNPFGVLGDADMDEAVEAAVRARLFNSGQDCLCAERFYVAEVIWATSCRSSTKL